MSRLRRFAALTLTLTAATLLAGCNRNPLLVKRSVCPAVAVPNYAGDMTVFSPEGSRDASAIDIAATITNVRGVCDEGATTLGTAVTFDVVARRTQTQGARTITLPYFASVVQGGNLVVSKQLGTVTLTFADGQLRTVGSAGAQARLARAAATLDPKTQALISRKRKAGDLDAATDPLADPEVKAAIRAISFEVLVGFQLDEAALGYNVLK